MQDRPTAPELLDALAEYLYAELRPHVPAEQRFKTLVAANLCAVVARELREGERLTEQDRQAFAELLGHPVDDERDAARELAVAIRRGERDAELDGVISALREHVRRKLEVARPGYAGD